MNARDLVILIPILVAIFVIILTILVARQVALAQRVRSTAVAVLCAQRGLLPADVVESDFGSLLGAFSNRWLSNSYASPDHAVAVADFVRPAGRRGYQYFSVLTFTVAGLNMPYVSVVRRIRGGLFIGGPPAVELESIDFDNRFTVRAKDRRSVVMLMDPGMMQLLLDCELVDFDMVRDRVLAFINRASEPLHQPSEPVEFEQLFRFFDGFTARMPRILLTEYAAAN